MLMAGNLFTELAMALRRTMSPSRKGDTAEPANEGNAALSRGRPPEQPSPSVDLLSKELASGISDKVVQQIKTSNSSPVPETTDRDRQKLGPPSSTTNHQKKNKLQSKRSLVSPASGGVPDIHPELTLEQVTSGASHTRPLGRQSSTEKSFALDMNTMFDYVPPGGGAKHKEALRFSRPRFREGRR
jgi:hypothetical protein